MESGAAVTVTLDGDRRTGTVLERSYTPNRGDELVAVELDDPLADGQQRVVVPADAVSPSA